MDRERAAQISLFFPFFSPFFPFIKSLRVASLAHVPSLASDQREEGRGEEERGEGRRRVTGGEGGKEGVERRLDRDWGGERVEGREEGMERG